MTRKSVNYESPVRSLWQGRQDGTRYHDIVKTLDLTVDTSFPTGEIFLIGFAVDEGVKRNGGIPGAAKGPSEVRKLLGNLAFHNLRINSIYDVGNVIEKGGDLESAQEELSAVVSDIAKNNHPIVIGGGHELAWPNYEGLSEARSGEDIAIINIDAHFDLRELGKGKANSGTSFNQIASYCKENNRPFNYFVYGLQKQLNTDAFFSKAKELQTEFVLADQVHDDIDNSLLKLNDFVNKHSLIYVSICMDVFSQAFAPGVSARSPLGLLPWQVLKAIQQIAKSKKTVGLGVAEYSPERDINGITGNLVASLIDHYIENLE